MIFFILIGSLFFIIGICFFIFGKRKSKRCSETTKGIVINVKERYSKGKNSTLVKSPVVKYMVKGKTVTVESSIYSSPMKLKKGDSVTVYYDPNSPTYMKIKEHDNNDMYIFGGVFTLIGFVFLIISIPSMFM